MKLARGGRLAPFCPMSSPSMQLNVVTSLAEAVSKAGYGTSAIEYVLPTMGR